MAQKHPLSRWTLPDVVDPPDTICFQVPVPNNKFHIAAFKGALFELAKAYSWQNDDDHTAKDVAAVWHAIFDNLEKCTDCPPNTGFAGADGGGEELIRQNPEKPCLLETSINGTEWCVFADLSLCIPAGGQPGNGSELPHDNGGEACYHGRMACNSQWLLPYQVSAGDQISVENLGGSGSDSPLGGWTCPGGQIFALGICVPGTGTYLMGDPLPSALHGALIVSIDGTWYDISAGAVSVPGGVSGANVYFQMNDSDISNNSGEYTFDVCATNNQAGTFSHKFEFKTGFHGWNIVNLGTGGQPAGEIVAGLGIQVTDFPRSGVNCRGAAIEITLPARDITRLGFEVNYTKGNTNSGTVVAESMDDGTDGPVYTFDDAIEGTNVIVLKNVSDSGATTYFCQIRTDNTPGALAGDGAILSVTIEGVGTDPASGL